MRVGGLISCTQLMLTCASLLTWKKTSGENEACSTSLTCWPSWRLLSCSCHLKQASGVRFSIGIWRCVHPWRLSQSVISKKPQALMSDLPSLSVLVVLCLMVSPVSGWRWCSTCTLWHTSLSILRCSEITDLTVPYGRKSHFETVQGMIYSKWSSTFTPGISLGHHSYLKAVESTKARLWRTKSYAFGGMDESHEKTPSWLKNNLLLELWWETFQCGLFSIISFSFSFAGI